MRPTRSEITQMQPDEIRPGLVLRVISHGIGAPVGSLATVKAIETSRSGDWVAVIEYHDTSRQPRHGTRFYRPHVWTNDLAYLEIVKDVRRVLEKPPSKAEALRMVKRAQLKLPLFEDES